MSAPKKVAQQKVLPLQDPHSVPELFANELTGIHINDGLCHFTLSAVRHKHSSRDTNEHERVVVARIVMPEKTAETLVAMYSQLKEAIKLKNMPPDGGSTETLN